MRMLSESHPKVWGKEVWLVNTPKYCCKMLHLDKGFHCSFHYHKKKDETFIVLEGKVEFKYTVNDTSSLLKRWFNNHIARNYETFTKHVNGSAQSKQSLHIPPYTIHSFSGITDAVILEVSTHHDDDDSYRITTSGCGDLT